MNNYLLIDLEDGSIPLTRIIAEDKEQALGKALEGLIKDKYLTVEGVCEDLGIELKEFPEELKVYE